MAHESSAQGSMDRRSFVGAMGAMGMVGGMAGALSALNVGSARADETAETETSAIGATPMNAVTMGNPNGEYWDTFAHMENPVMTREEALDFLYNPQMCTEDVTLDDGTVIPAVYINPAPLHPRWHPPLLYD